MTEDEFLIDDRIIGIYIKHGLYDEAISFMEKSGVINNRYADYLYYKEIAKLDNEKEQ